MTAKIIRMSVYREAHKRVVFDPYWLIRFWLAFWGIK